MRLACSLLVVALAACSVAPRDELTVARDAGAWRPLLDDPGLALAGPPAPGSSEAEADRVAVAAWAAKLATPAGARDREAIRRWTTEDPARLWAAEARRLVGTFDVADPPRAARVLAYAQVAASDALIATWAMKQRFARPGPGGASGLPSYPSEHAAVARAAAGVLAVLLPEHAAGLAATADAVVELPVAAGLAFPSDAAAGAALGERVAGLAIARLRAEEAAAQPVATPGEAWPIGAAAGSWTGWTDGAALEPGPAPDGALRAREARAALAANQAIGIRERALAIKWGEGDMARHWSARAAELAGRAGLAAPEAGRVLAFTGVALEEAAIAAFRAQWARRLPRPLALARGLTPVLATPGSPGWPADGAAMAHAAAGYLAAAFPGEAAGLRAEAVEAGEAGVFVGWALPSDVAAGRALGEAVAAAVVVMAGEAGGP